MDPSSYLKTVLTVIERVQGRNGRPGVLLSYLGVCLRREGLDWAAFGYPRLSAVTDELRRAGVIRVSVNNRTEVIVEATKPADDSRETRLTTSQQGPTEDVLMAQPFRPLRFSLWQAFSLPSEESHYLDRSTGLVQRGTAPANGAAIEPIPADVQRGWAQDFLRKSALAAPPDLELMLNSPKWFRQFAEFLRRTGVGQLAAWNRFRSHLIIAYAKNWAERNSVPQDRLFQEPSKPKEAQAKGSEESPLASAAAQAPSERRNDGIREVLLASIAEMSTEELLKFPIPPHILLRHVRPDLSR